MPAGNAYSRELLLSLRTTAQLLQCDVREHINSLTRKTRRGRRAGRPRRTQPAHTYIEGSLIPIVTGNRPPPRCVSLYARHVPTALRHMSNPWLLHDDTVEVCPQSMNSTIPSTVDQLTTGLVAVSCSITISTPLIIPSCDNLSEQQQTETCLPSDDTRLLRSLPNRRRRSNITKLRIERHKPAVDQQTLLTLGTWNARSIMHKVEDCA